MRSGRQTSDLRLQTSDLSFRLEMLKRGGETKF